LWRDNDGVMAEMSDGFMLMVMMVVTRRWTLDVGNTHPLPQSATQPLSFGVSLKGGTGNQETGNRK